MTGLAPEVLKQMRAGQTTGDAERDALARFGRTPAETGGTIRAEACSASTAAGDTDRPPGEISPALAVTVFMNVCNRIHDTAIALPAVAVRKGMTP